MDISEEQAAYLLASLKNGSAMLVLGAGASISSKNGKGEPIKSGWALAKTLCERAGLPYADESLTDVLSAVRGRTLSDQIITEILIREYRGCKPSKELEALFNYSWKRIYTWNIDDAIENVNRSTLQRRVFYNGMIDKAVEFEGPNCVHVIHLHGEIAKPEHKLIMTEHDYAFWIKSGKHYWYQRAAQDYLSTCPIFIGSQLAEPIMAAELERAKREQGGLAGRAYLITPDDMSPVKKASFATKGITHLKGTLEQFSVWLQNAAKGGWSPKDVVARTNLIPERSLAGITNDEVLAASFLRFMEPKVLRTKFGLLSQPEQQRCARLFLQGFAPDWRIVASDVPVWLDACDDLYDAMTASISRNDKLFVVSGQAGSGKTTALMMACLRYSEKNDTPVYELDANVKSISDAFRLLRRIKSKKAILYIGDLFLYGDFFKDDLTKISGEDFIVVSTSRTGEWNEHLGRYLGGFVTPFSFQRFSRKDYDPLIARLLEYVPSPAFRRLSRQQQHEKLGKSRSQLLIALRETTGSENFDLVITNEFQGLPDNDTQRLFIIVGLATLARVGITSSVANEAYSHLGPGRAFADALSALDGIVGEHSGGRLFARHELYVRHVLETTTPFSEISRCIIAVLTTFTKYNIPVIKMVNRSDSYLFRFLMNHHFIESQARRHKAVLTGVEIYEMFEVDFQLDGHYWLQYGLYLSGIPRLYDASKMLARSIAAYPGNAFAVHALADIELRLATSRPQYDSATRALIDKAVTTLMAQDANHLLEIDRYPIVTLAKGHIGALVKHGQTKEAKESARKYFDRLQQLEKASVTSSAISAAKGRLAVFITHGIWGEKARKAAPPRKLGNARRKKSSPRQQP